jgi:hypothetical protein
MNRVAVLLITLSVTARVSAECAAPAGIYAACSSEASTTSNGSSDSFDSRFSSSVLIIGLGIGIGFGIVYFISQAFKSESGFATQFPRPREILGDSLSYSTPLEPSRIPSALYGTSEWRMNLPAFRW